MKAYFVSFALGFNYFVGFYYGVVSIIYTTLLTIALFVILRHAHRIKYEPFREYSISPETPSISILIPAYNEEKVVVRTIRSTLAVDYPLFEVIVINDGSEDGTLEAVIGVFGLKKIDLVYRNILHTVPVKGFYANPEIPNLIVIDKERSGKADALNCGITVSRSAYFCSVDADSLLERDSLIKLMTPIMESRSPVIASGGVVRILNGVTLKDTAIQEIGLPQGFLAMSQIVEYTRTFLFGRMGWNALNSLLILSGAFSLFHKAAVVEVGGYRRGSITEDMEIIVRLHEHYLRQKKPYRIKFISDPICWTEVPESLKMLGRQRRRWHLGLLKTMCQHRSLIFNPKYGRMGLLVLPYYLFFETLGPVVELTGYVAVVCCYLLGLLSTDFVLLFLTLAIFYGTFLSTAGVFLSELTYRRYPKWSHFLRLVKYSLLENFCYRQMNAYWRTQALIQFIRGRSDWEHVADKGQGVTGEVPHDEP
ncbi:MAG TPA: glycosyltransferase [Nitrospirota bacterium]|nr:glycosyltransferase [Nitrospirota bacterium]